MYLLPSPSVCGVVSRTRSRKCIFVIVLTVIYLYNPVSASMSPISLRRSLEDKEQKVVVLEVCKTSLQQEVSKLRSIMRELEKSRLQARRELQELRRQVRLRLLLLVLLLPQPLISLYLYLFR